ncbi:MAG: DUF2079 domain-containing protein [Oscillospiraceae bacterium]|nr:DUF2079 domain-containing protein [Oscillospiraceae bacterium]
MLAWLLAVCVEYSLLPRNLRDLSSTDGLPHMSVLRVSLLWGGTAIALCILGRFRNIEKLERWGMVAAFAYLGLLSLWVSATVGFVCICVGILLILVFFALHGRNSSPEPVCMAPPAAPRALWFITGLSLLFFLFVAGWSLCRVYSFGTPTYDFGLFSQMFYNMSKSGLPMTTLERDGLLSHFAVHVSPIYYLLLPIYCLFPKPETLQILQALVMASAVIPLWKLCRYHGLAPTQCGLLCALLLLFPAFSGGASYDLHENCFLTPLLFWLFYGIRKRQTPLVCLCAVLLLSVKEDAAVYVAVIGLWLLASTILQHKEGYKWDLITALSLITAALLWFFLVTSYLENSGDGVMTDRYSNLMNTEGSPLSVVVKAVLLNPMKAIYECVDPEKTEYLSLTLLPLLGLPLLTRRYERYILLIPYVLVNLLPDYSYQHDVFFQYNFGSLAFLFYLTVVNLADLRECRVQLFSLIPAVILCVVCFASVILPRFLPYPTLATRNADSYKNIRNTLDLIPEDATVTASTYYTTYLSGREIIYDAHYGSRNHILETEYIVLDPEDPHSYKKYAAVGKDNGFKNFLIVLKINGYREFASTGSRLVIYKKDS